MANSNDIIEQGQCDISVLAKLGAQDGMGGLDQIDFQALKVWFLAQIVYSVSTGNYDVRDICALASGLKQYDYLSQNDRHVAMIEQMLLCTESLLGEHSQEDAKAAMACAHCCNITKASLESAEICLWNLLCQYQGRGPV